MTMVRLENISSGYNGEVILHDIDLTVNRGEIVGILGPNGSGKTTLLRTISRILTPSSGTVFFEEKDMAHYAIKELAKKIAVVSQDVETEHMTVEEYVLLGRLPHYGSWQFFDTGKDRDVAATYMNMTDIIQYRARQLDRISGGEKQLAHIAKALAQQPRLLLLDEPTSYLDITHQVKIMDLIRRLNRELGITILMVLHDLNIASEYSDRLVLLNNGAIVKTGDPDTVLTYQNIEEVYKTRVVVKKSPVSGKPHVMVVPGDMV